MMDDLMYQLDMDRASGQFGPSLVDAPGAAFVDGLGYDHDFYGTCAFAPCAPLEPGCGAYMADNTLIPGKEGWLEETADLSNFLRHEALSPTKESSPVGSVTDGTAPLDVDPASPRLKSPMEIFKEIEQEASHILSAGNTPPSSPPMQVAQMAPQGVATPSMQFAGGYGGGSPPREYAELAPMQPMAMEIDDGLVQGEGPPIQVVPMVQPQTVVIHATERPPEMKPEEVNAILEAQLPYIGMGGSPPMQVPAAAPEPSPEPVVIQEQPMSSPLQVVQIEGNEVLFPDGTRAVIVKRSDGGSLGAASDADVSAASPGLPEPPRKKRTYQKGSYERKKMQNRESAQRYRIKKRQEKEVQKGEYKALTDRNRELKAQVQDVQKEIEYWQKFINDLKMS